MRVYHNSREEVYREPFGAVRLGGAVLLRLDVYDVDDVKAVCRLWCDGKGETLIPMSCRREDGALRFECTFAPDEPQLLWYSFILESGGERSFYGAREGRTGGEGMLYPHEPPSFQITVYKERKAPEWYKNAIVYQIFPDRFCRGDDWKELTEKSLSVSRTGPARTVIEDWYRTPHYKKDENGRVISWDFYGGTLSGISKKLPYLKELGVTAIYLNPIFEAASNHRYDTGDYLKLDAMLGGDGAFERFAAEAESFGISLILDGVFNHTGCDSIYFNKYGNYEGKGAFQSEASPYRKWYRIAPDGSYGCWWGVDDLPDLEENDPEYREFILGENGVVRRWLKAGAKGWRLDVADELPDDFIAGIKEAVTDTLGDEGLLIGEVWEDASNKISYGELRRYFLGDELDSVMNYPLRDALLDFLNERIPASEVCERLASLYENYPPEAFYSALNLIGSHDRARLLTLLGEAPPEGDLTPEQRRDYRLSDWQRNLAKGRLWLAVLVQMTMPGVPCIYYGDEAGLEGYSDPYNRAAFPWGKEDGDTAASYRGAIALRKELPLFTDGGFKPFYCGEDVFGFIRDHGSESAAVVINRSRHAEREAVIPVSGGGCVELLSGRGIVAEGNKARVVLPPLGSAVIYFAKDSLGLPMRRGAGVLCHITSLPNDGALGNIGAPSRAFVDFLRKAGQRYWQILPLNPTDSYGSPYAGPSAFAANTALIDTDGKTLEELYNSFEPDAAFEDFCQRNACWLDGYAAFMALKEKFNGDPWQQWPKKYRSFSEEVFRDKYVAKRSGFYKFGQFLFESRWQELKSYANERGVSIIGDMPMYVSEDSADVWEHRELFALDEKGLKTCCAGVPPDYFSDDGQSWGNPLYDWAAMKNDGYRWWIERMRRAFGLFDYLRLDHFRGFEAFWSIPEGEKSAMGSWVKGPGAGLFEAAYNELGPLPIIAEDLGVITNGVRTLITRCGFPGMDVMQFYDGDPAQGYTPPMGKIVYTGTHDNQTLIGWCSNRYGKKNAAKTAKKLMETAMESKADVVILPLQDVLRLGDEARMNTPGTASGNWGWQAQNKGFSGAVKRLRDLADKTERR